MSDILYKHESYEIIGACMEVHRELGGGMAEAIYQAAAKEEFGERSIPHQSEQELRVFYKGVELSPRYRPDFLCYDQIIVEFKAITEILPEHEAQLFNYLRITKHQLGILVNFGKRSLETKRIALTR